MLGARALCSVGRLNKRLPVASDSPGASDSYDAAVDSMGYGYLACFGVVFSVDGERVVRVKFHFLHFALRILKIFAHSCFCLMSGNTKAVLAINNMLQVV